MKKIYVVCEDYTGAFMGLYVNKNEADEKAEEIGGYVEEFEVNFEKNS